MIPTRAAPARPLPASSHTADRLAEAEFAALAAFLKRRSGLSLGPDKGYLAESRLAPVARRAGLPGLGALVSALAAGRAPDLEREVVEAMTTNETFFFRDRTPFDLFRDAVLPEALARLAERRRLRVWCAAASTGQEPYSLAMLLAEAAPRLAGWSVEIVASDLSEEVIERARRGVYSRFEVQRGLPPDLLARHFEAVGERWRVSAAIRAMVDFRAINLLHGFEGLGAFDVIFCRNVLIYFDPATKADVLARLARRLAPGGALFLGAAETVIGLTDRLRAHPQHRGLYVHTPNPHPAG